MKFKLKSVADERSLPNKAQVIVFNKTLGN